MGEQGLMNDDRLLITDGVHTDNTDETEVRRRTMVGERESSEFKRSSAGGRCCEQQLS